MNKISLKFGLWFLGAMLILEIFLFFFLHTSIVDSRIEEELAALQARGNSHRDVLENSYKEETLHHIAVMEAKADTEVIITDQNQNIIITSSKFDNEEQKIITKEIGQVPRDGEILENRWKSEKYISTVTPFKINQNQKGNVYMFRSTDQIQSLISRLNHHFIAGAIMILTLMIITILFLSKALTTPLIRMKRATEKLSKGDFSVNLPDMGDDELGELSRSIKILAEDLKHLKEERNEFLASISHELRTPLTYIKGYADVSRRKDIDETIRDQYLSIIFEETKKLSDMMKDLFDLAKLDKNTFVIDRMEVELCSFLNSICEKMLPAFTEKGMELAVECKKNVNVLIDPMRFEQVIFNLLDNAIKYSEPHAKTSISVKSDKGMVLLIIKDEGRGIPKGDLPYIFDRFYRVDKSRSRDTGGSGLGLSIVKELLEAHEGTIEIKSEQGKGTAFFISLKELP
ncbi:sensor histidine kinase [Peribacillus sp. FSL M8-0224]|uniref:sensor histidine kinase n=1 Tax=Peribacillus sp. FSL M8-0224 TaxID=2921568 RepID=UPI0030F6EE64|nr:HAMP domain-containing histidine kinase [Brevibacterium sp. PAMC21349]